jgi:signal transduction histidine kinase
MLAATVLVLSALGLNTLVSTLLGRHGPAGLGVPFASIAFLGSCLIVVLAIVMRRVGGPLADVVEAANRIAGGDYAARIVEHGPPSLRTVGRAFNGMAARLESQERLRRQLMADVAHELRTPLSVVQGRIEGIIDGVYPLDSAQLGQVLVEARMLARLVEDLRTLAHAESGTLTLRKEATDVAILLHEAVDAFSVEAQAAQVSLRVDAPGELPPASVDPLRLREVVTNLIANALQHTPAGGSVSIELRTSGNRMVVAVADTGSGISAGDLPKIFDRFYKGASSRGSGLGLAIARNLIAAHGGDIQAGSQPGRGTTITFSVPTAD